MKQLSLTVSNRQNLGRGHSRRMRNAGSIPAIIYGPAGNHSVSVEQEKFRDLMRAKGNAAALIELTLEGKKMLSIIKEFQRHPITLKFLHIDIQQIDPNALMSVAIPIRTVGEAHGVKTDGGTLAIVSQTINVRCLPKDLPEFIEVDVTELKVNESIHVGALKAPAGITFPGDQLVSLWSAPKWPPKKPLPKPPLLRLLASKVLLLRPLVPLLQLPLRLPRSNFRAGRPRHPFFEVRWYSRSSPPSAIPARNTSPPATMRAGSSWMRWPPRPARSGSTKAGSRRPWPRPPSVVSKSSWSSRSRS